MSQHPHAHGLSRVPMPMPPVPRSIAAPRREHGPGSLGRCRSPGVPGVGKKEQGEREVLTRAARDIAGLGLQLGALAGFPSVPRGHAPPRPGPGPSPAGHRAQAPRGPLLPHAVNCNTAQRRRPTFPDPRGAPASSSSWHRGVLAITDPLCPGAPWQSRTQPRLPSVSRRHRLPHRRTRAQTPRAPSRRRCHYHSLPCSSLPFGVPAPAAHVPRTHAQPG